MLGAFMPVFYLQLYAVLHDIDTTFAFYAVRFGSIFYFLNSNFYLAFSLLSLMAPHSWDA